MTRMITGSLLLAILAGLCIHAALAQPAAAVKGPPLVPSKPIQTAYWLAECAGPLPAPYVARRWDGPREASILMQLDIGRVMAEAVLLGEREKGWQVWSVVGPAELYKHQASDPKACRMVSTYADAAASGDALWRDWVTARSTCIGTEKAKPTAEAVAPCSDAKTAEIDVKRIAPPVLYGTEDVSAAEKLKLEAVPVKPAEKVK